MVRACTACSVVPNIVLIHADVAHVLRLAAAGQTSKLADYLAAIFHRLSLAGAEVAAIPSITPHVCAAALAQRSLLPFINILDTLAHEARRRNIRRAAIFGTRTVIESNIFGALPEVDLIEPTPGEIDLIHTNYLELVNTASARPQQHTALTTLAQTLIARERLDAILLAGTELSLLFTPANTPFPHIDAARVHIDAILNAIR
ncbi:MAG: aspartate/glutamate racemase family protein [Acidobacteriaceae bacterium]